MAANHIRKNHEQYSAFIDMPDSDDLDPEERLEKWAISFHLKKLESNHL